MSLAGNSNYKILMELLLNSQQGNAELDALKKKFVDLNDMVARAGAAYTAMSAKSAEGLQRTARATESLGASLRNITQIAAEGFLAFKLFEKFEGLIKNMALTAARTETLELVTRNMGKTAGYTSDMVTQQVEAIKKIGITTREANQTVAMFFQANLKLADSTKLARVAQDAAVVANMDSSQTLQGLIHGIQTYNPLVLRTYGIIVNTATAMQKYAVANNTTVDKLGSTARQQAFLNAVLEEGQKLAGNYELSMTSVGKQLTSLPRFIEEAKDALGKSLLPALRQIVITITEWLSNEANIVRMQVVMSQLGSVLQTVFSVFTSLVNFTVNHSEWITPFLFLSTVLTAVHLKSLLFAELMKTKMVQAFVAQVQATVVATAEMRAYAVAQMVAQGMSVTLASSLGVLRMAIAAVGAAIKWTLTTFQGWMLLITLATTLIMGFSSASANTAEISALEAEHVVNAKVKEEKALLSLLGQYKKYIEQAQEVDEKMQKLSASQEKTAETEKKLTEASNVKNKIESDAQFILDGINKLTTNLNISEGTYAERIAATTVALREHNEVFKETMKQRADEAKRVYVTQKQKMEDEQAGYMSEFSKSYRTDVTYGMSGVKHWVARKIQSDKELEEAAKTIEPDLVKARARNDREEIARLINLSDTYTKYRNVKSALLKLEKEFKQEEIAIVRVLDEQAIKDTINLDNTRMQAEVDKAANKARIERLGIDEKILEKQKEYDTLKLDRAKGLAAGGKQGETNEKEEIELGKELLVLRQKQTEAARERSKMLLETNVLYGRKTYEDEIKWYRERIRLADSEIENSDQRYKEKINAQRQIDALTKKMSDEEIARLQQEQRVKELAFIQDKNRLEAQKVLAEQEEALADASNNVEAKMAAARTIERLNREIAASEQRLTVTKIESLQLLVAAQLAAQKATNIVSEKTEKEKEITALNAQILELQRKLNELKAQSGDMTGDVRREQERKLLIDKARAFKMGGESGAAAEEEQQRFDNELANARAYFDESEQQQAEFRQIKEQLEYMHYQRLLAIQRQYFEQKLMESLGFSKEEIEVMKDAWGRMTAAIGDMAQVQSIIGRREADEWKESETKKLDAEHEALLAHARTEKTRNKIDADYAAKKEALDKQAEMRAREGAKTWFALQKIAAIAEITVNGAIAVSKAWVEGGPILGSVLAAMVAAQIAAQIALVNAQESGYAKGGYTGDGNTYEVAGAVHKGEFVFSKQKTKKLRPLLEMLNAGADREMTRYATGGYVTGSAIAMQVSFDVAREMRMMNMQLAAYLANPVPPTLMIGRRDARKIINQGSYQRRRMVIR